MVFAAEAAFPVYEVLIFPSGGEQRELCEAVAVRLKEMPLRIEARIIAAGADPGAESPSGPDLRAIAVLILGDGAERSGEAAGSLEPFGAQLERTYEEALERSEGRLIAVVCGDGERAPSQDPAGDPLAAFTATLCERHRLCAPPVRAALNRLDRLAASIAASVRELICEELALIDAESLDTAFAEPEDASAALLAELCRPAGRAAAGGRASRALEDLGAGPVPFSAADALWFDAADEPLDPLRQPARARAIEQRQEGRRAFEVGEYSAAIRHLRRALEELPIDVPGGYWLARLLAVTGGAAAWTEAWRVAQRVARIAGREGRKEHAARARITAARAAAGLGQCERAEEQARQAVSCAPWLAAPWIELACQCARRDSLEAAYQAVREAFHRDPRALLQLNREAAMRDMPALYRTWKRTLRDELTAAVGEALGAEQRVARILDEERAGEASAPSPAAPDQLSGLPLLDVVSAGRQAADRAVKRMSAFAGRVRAAAAELGLVEEASAAGELVPLRIGAEGAAGGHGGIQVLNWLYQEGERVPCGRPLLRYEERRAGGGRELRTVAAPRTGILARIDVASGPLPADDAPIGMLRTVAGLGVELGDRLENCRTEEAELNLGAKRRERELRRELRRAALWGIPALAALVFAASTPDWTELLLRAAMGAVLAIPALHALGSSVRHLRLDRNGARRLVLLRAATTDGEVELARLWDDFRLLADRFSRAVAAWEDGMPVEDLFTPGAEWGQTGWSPGRLVRLQSKDRPADDHFALDDPLFPPEFAAHLPASQVTSRAALYRVIGTRDARVLVARWATYFTVRG